MRLLRRQISVAFLLSVSVFFAAHAKATTGGRTAPSNVQIHVGQPTRSFELRLAQKNAAKGLTVARAPYGNRRLYLHPTAIVTHRDVIEARAVRERFEPSFNIEVTFSPAASKRLAKATKPQVGRQVAILINGRVIAVPELKRAISDSALISGTFTRNEAERIAGELIALAENSRAR